MSLKQDFVNYVESNFETNPLPEGLTEYWENCASCLDNMGLVVRPYEMDVHYYDVDGNEHEEKFEGFESTVLSHELDHLDGILRMLQRKCLFLLVPFLEVCGN